MSIDELIACVIGHVDDPASATLAAEELGRRVVDVVFPSLVTLLSSKKAYVREGAWLGLGQIANLCPSVLQLASYAISSESSPGVSDTIDDVVADVEDCIETIGRLIQR